MDRETAVERIKEVHIGLMPLELFPGAEVPFGT